jgi:hypothetical protein
MVLAEDGVEREYDKSGHDRTPLQDTRKRQTFNTKNNDIDIDY